MQRGEVLFRGPAPQPLLRRDNMWLLETQQTILNGKMRGKLRGRDIESKPEPSEFTEPSDTPKPLYDYPYA